MTRLAVLGLLLAACADDAPAVPAGDRPDPRALLDAGLAREACPDEYRVRFDTTKGPITVDVKRAWTPDGATRLWNLVRIGYFTDVAIYRVVPGFVAQFGMHGDPAVCREWSRARIADNPRVVPNRRGTLVFAAGETPHSRTCQLFFNLADNPDLDEKGFAPVGDIVDGIDVLDRLYDGYGEMRPGGTGPSQRAIAEGGNAYLRQEFPELDYIVRAQIVE